MLSWHSSRHVKYNTNIVTVSPVAYARIYIKLDIKTAPTCFGAVTPSSRNALLVLAKVTAVKIAN
jgi:hypothetical protein